MILHAEVSLTGSCILLENCKRSPPGKNLNFTLHVNRGEHLRHMWALTRQEWHRLHLFPRSRICLKCLDGPTEKKVSQTAVKLLVVELKSSEAPACRWASYLEQSKSLERLSQKVKSHPHILNEKALWDGTSDVQRKTSQLFWRLSRSKGWVIFSIALFLSLKLRAL